MCIDIEMLLFWYSLFIIFIKKSIKKEKSSDGDNGKKEKEFKVSDIGGGGWRGSYCAWSEYVWNLKRAIYITDLEPAHIWVAFYKYMNDNSALFRWTGD